MADTAMVPYDPLQGAGGRGAEGEDDGWNTEQIAALQKAYFLLEPTLNNYWQVGGQSVLRDQASHGVPRMNSPTKSLWAKMG
eukprot:6100679-Pyramimonas_sp.AAC.1